MEVEMEQIYNILMGHCISENASKERANIFAAGTVCDRLYTEVYEAKLRINRRLGTQEDSDVERIIDNLLQITKIVSCKMYTYGTKTENQLENASN